MLDTVKEFTYKRLSPEEQKQRGILGRLVGPIADFKNPTRNERYYSEALWDKTFDQPLMKEKLENKLLLGELGHPTDRTDIDMEKVAICLAEKPVKTKDGKVRGIFDILDTPNGRILKTLCDYGCKIGVSSRGTGDVSEDYERGGEQVDPDTYEMECWDAVLIPAVKDARPQYVTESLNKNSLKKALNEALEKSQPDEQKVMVETLKNLDIDINSDEDIDIKEEDQKDAANNDGAELVDQLQESLKNQEALESKVQELQEKLSVCYAKEAKYEEDINKYKKTIVNLSESAKRAKVLRSKVDYLNEKLQIAEDQINTQTQNTRELKESLTKTVTQKDSFKTKNFTLTEQLKSKDKEIKGLKEQLKSLSESTQKEKDELNESINSIKQNLTIKSKDYSNKLAKANQLVEHYKKIAQTSIDRYIQSKAKTLGISSNEIVNKLSENYSFNEIDQICEDLKSYKLNVSRLPFQLNKNTKIQIVESKKEPLKTLSGFDDTVDEDLIRLAESVNL